MAMNYPAGQYVEDGIDLRLQQQVHFAQPSVLKLSQKPIVYYQDTQPENSLIPNQFNRNSYRQATLSDYEGKCLPDGDQSPPLSHYSGVTAKSEPHWRHNARQNHQLNHSDYQTQRRPSPHIPQSEMQSHPQQHSKHFRFLSQEIYRGPPQTEYDDTISQPSLLDTQPDRQTYFKQYPPQSSQLPAQHELQAYESSCDAYPPYYHPSKQRQQPQTVPQNATFHPNPNYTAKFRSQELHTPKRAPNYSSSIISHDYQHKVLHGAMSSVPSLHRALSPTEAKVQELYAILVTSQEITSLCRAATTIQQMTYGDDAVKAYFREVGAIQALISHLQSTQDSVLSSTLGALRNLSYGVELNKRVIASGWGLSNLMQLLVRTQLPELRELTTCVLWNVSSSEYLKKGFLDICLDDLVRSSVVPLANWDTDSVALSAMDPSNPSHVKWNAELKNSTGILRNLASFGKDCRIRLRGCGGLIDSILYIICSALGRDDLDNQIVENCVCILRNLSYRLESEVDLQEGTEERQIRWETPEPISNPNYTTTTTPASEEQSRRWFKYFCISFKRNPRRRSKSNSKSLSPQKSITPSRVHKPASLQEKVNGNTYDHLQKGVSLLWQPEIADMYILILKECSNRESIEATLGAILNITACEWKWASYIRTAVRNKKGLPLIIKIITTTDNELMIKSASTALRFLSYDWNNKLLIGDYALAQLVERLPGGKHCYGLNDACYQSILSTINELIQKCPDNINHLFMSKNCISTLAKLACSNNHSPKTIYLANKVCLYLFEDNISRPTLKKEGWSISNWQKIVDWLEQETSSTPSDSHLSGPYNPKNTSLKNAIRPRAKSDTIAEKKTSYLHRTLDVDHEGSLFRESSIASGSSRVTQQTDSQQPYNRQKRIGPHTAIINNYGRNQFATYNPHRRLDQAISYPEAALRHPLEQVHRDSPLSFTSHSPKTTPLQPGDPNPATSRNYCYIPDLSTQQQATDPRITPLDPRMGGECQVEREHKRPQQRTPSPNPSVTTGQEESKESLRFELKEEQVKQRDMYTRVDIKKKRERRLTAHVRQEDLSNTKPQENISRSDQSKLDQLPSKYNPIMAPQLPLNARPKDLGRMVNLRFEQPEATDSWV